MENVSAIFMAGMEYTKDHLSTPYEWLMYCLRILQGNQIEQGAVVERRRDDDLDRLLRAHDVARKNSESVDRLIQRGDELLQTLRENNYHWQRGNYDQRSEQQNVNKLTVEMELPEDPKELDGALQRFWSTLRTHAATNTEQNKERSPATIENLDDDLPQMRHPIAASAPPAESEHSVVPYQRHSQTAAVPPVRTRWNERQLKSKEKATQSEYGMHDISHEEQLEIACQRSFREDQEAKDLIIAQRLQEEERKLKAFRYHEDMAMKRESLDDGESY